MINRIKQSLMLAFVIALALSSAGAALAQTTAFTYQGRLTDNGNPANGIYDLTFKLFDSATVGSGTQQGAALSLSNVEVTNGTFSVQLDFGACASCFDGADRFLEISIKPAGGGAFTTLEPRQELTAIPYAIKSLSSAVADGLSVTCVNCVTSSQIASVNGTAVNGAIPVASVPAGSGNYIQNTTTQQASSNFNISGNGTAGGTLTANSVSVNAGGFTLNDNFLRLRGANDGNHGMVWSPVVDGPEFRSFSGFRWQNGSGVLTERMRLDGAGSLTISGKIGVGTNFLDGAVAQFGPTGEFRIASPAGGTAGRLIVRENGFVGIGSQDPKDRLDIVGGIRLTAFGDAGINQLCRNGFNQISFCSSSLRYKTNIADLHSGLNLINRLRPVTFDWRESKKHDLGLVAEEVAEVEPLLTIRNDKGEIEGVKYDRISAVLINAIKEQQSQIESLKARLAALERLVSRPPQAGTISGNHQ